MTKQKKKPLDPFDNAILKAMKKIDIPLSSRRIANTTEMHQNTAKLHIGKLSKLGRIKPIKFGKRKKFKLL